MLELYSCLVSNLPLKFFDEKRGEKQGGGKRIGVGPAEVRVALVMFVTSCAPQCQTFFWASSW